MASQLLCKNQTSKRGEEQHSIFSLPLIDSANKLFRVDTTKVVLLDGEIRDVKSFYEVQM